MRLECEARGEMPMLTTIEDEESKPFSCVDNRVTDAYIYWKLLWWRICCCEQLP